MNSKSIRYCYWSMARGEARYALASCVASAKRCGVPNDFVVLVDGEVEGATCFDLCGLDVDDDSGWLLAVSEGLVKLKFDYYVYIHPKTIFRSRPISPHLLAKGCPVHAPLLSRVSGTSAPRGYSSDTEHYIRLATRLGVYNELRYAASGFWIIRHNTIGFVRDVAAALLSEARRECLKLSATAVIGYVVQVLCADPGYHDAELDSAIWSSSECMADSKTAPRSAIWLE